MKQTHALATSLKANHSVQADEDKLMDDLKELTTKSKGPRQVAGTNAHVSLFLAARLMHFFFSQGKLNDYKIMPLHGCTDSRTLRLGDESPGATVLFPSVSLQCYITVGVPFTGWLGI